MKMVSLQQNINNKINGIGYNDHCAMIVHDVVNAVSIIKSGKHDG